MEEVVVVVGCAQEVLAEFISGGVQHGRTCQGGGGLIVEMWEVQLRKRGLDRQDFRAGSRLR